jgi:hypothetical protein
VTFFLACETMDSLKNLTSVLDLFYVNENFIKLLKLLMNQTKLFQTKKSISLFWFFCVCAGEHG